MGKDFIINLHTIITILYCCDYMNWTGITMITRLHRNNNSRSWGNCDSYFWSELICLPVMTTRHHKGVNTRNEMVNTQRPELKKKCTKVRVIYSLMSHLSSFLYMLGIFGIELTWGFEFSIIRCIAWKKVIDYQIDPCKCTFFSHNFSTCTYFCYNFIIKNKKLSATMVHVGTKGGKWGNFYLNGSM